MYRSPGKQTYGIRYNTHEAMTCSSLRNHAQAKKFIDAAVIKKETAHLKENSYCNINVPVIHRYVTTKAIIQFIYMYVLKKC